MPMTSKFKNKKITWFLIVTVLVAWMITIPDRAAGETGNRYRGPEVQFLEEKYSICFGSVINNGEFISALAKVLNLDYTEQSSRIEGITPNSKYFKTANALYKDGVLTESKLDADSRLTSINAVALAVRAAGLKEVVDTYNRHKTDVAISKLGLSGSKLQPSLMNELAVAIDSELLPQSCYKNIHLNEAVTPELAAVLLTKVLAFHGEYLPANYLGYITDEDIYGKVYTTWKNAKLIKDRKLLEVVNEGVTQGLINGYNLRDKDNVHRFDERRTIRYGHSSIKHALQLIALLKSEGLNAKVQFEPKTSAYIYLKEWGKPSITPDFTVAEFANGIYVAYAKEYDISFEFQTLEQKQAFQTIIFKYAKKDRENQQGLIYDAWWQPLYTSVTPISGYQTVTDHVITDGHYEIHTFSLEENSFAVLSGLMAISPDMQVAQQTVWVDNPFYQYLLGGYR
ncbi:hypothetical protein [Sporomusa silvacetica]